MGGALSNRRQEGGQVLLPFLPLGSQLRSPALGGPFPAVPLSRGLPLSLTAAFSRCPLSEPPGSLLEPDSGGCPCRASHMDDANLSPSLHFQRQEQGYSGPLRSDQVCLGARQWRTGNLGLQGLCSAHGVSQSHVRGVQCTQGQAWPVLSWANSRGCCWLLGGGQLL